MIFCSLLINSLELVQCYEPKSPDSCGRRENLTTEPLVMEWRDVAVETAGMGQIPCGCMGLERSSGLGCGAGLGR